MFPAIIVPMSLSLLDWRRQVAALYADVRAHAATDPEGSLQRFRAGRDELFATHPESPLVDGGTPPAYWPYRADLRFDDVDVDGDVPAATFAAEGSTFSRIGRVHLPVGDLDLYWLDGYGGGLFLPFRDTTAGTTSYGGGRYLIDTVKGADLGGDLTLDFNYAYHPSCFYDPAWACPLAPHGNRLAVPVEAGERIATSR